MYQANTGSTLARHTPEAPLCMVVVVEGGHRSKQVCKHGIPRWLPPPPLRFTFATQTEEAEEDEEEEEEEKAQVDVDACRLQQLLTLWIGVVYVAVQRRRVMMQACTTCTYARARKEQQFHTDIKS